MAENEGVFLPTIDKNVQEIQHPKLTHRNNSFSGHVFLSPQIYAQRVHSGKGHIDIEEDIQKLSIGSSSTIQSSPACVRRTACHKEPEEGHGVRGQHVTGSRSGSSVSYKSQSPASTPGLRRRKLEHKISPLAGEDYSMPEIRPRAKSFSANNRSESLRTFKSNLITSASRDSLDVGLSRLDVTDNILYSDKSHRNNQVEIPTETLEKCQKWLEGVSQAGDLERPLNAVVCTNIEWSDE